MLLVGECRHMASRCQPRNLARVWNISYNKYRMGYISFTLAGIHLWAHPVLPIYDFVAIFGILSRSRLVSVKTSPTRPEIK